MTQLSKSNLVAMLEKQQKAIMTFLDKPDVSQYDRAYEQGYYQCLTDILGGVKELKDG